MIASRLFDHLDVAAHSRGECPALVLDSTMVTYADYRLRALAFAADLLQVGVRRHDRVAVMMPNSLEFCYATLGAAYIGATIVPVNVRYTLDEVAFILDDCEPAAICASHSFAGSFPFDIAKRCAEGRSSVGAIYYVGDPADRPDPRSRPFPWNPAPADRETVEKAATEVRADDPLLIIYTSGTTGRPKGAQLSHGAVCCSAEGYADGLCLTAVDRLSVFTPMFHAGGLVNGIATALVRGSTAVLMPSFDPSAALDVLTRERVSVYLAVPTMLTLQLLLPQFQEYRFENLRVIVSGGAPVSSALITAATQHFRPRHFQVVYGLTEANIATMTRSSDDDITRLHSAGRPTKNFEVRIVAPEHVQTPVDATGEIAVRGGGLFSGYWRNPEATAAVVDADNWFYTGDLGHINAAGALRVIGRLKDMYIQGGTNVYPAEIETALLAHPDVAMAAVVGMPDEILGEVGCAFVVPKSHRRITAVELRDFAAQRLAKYKLPRHFELREALPLTPFGKIRKVALRAEAAAIARNGAFGDRR